MPLEQQKVALSPAVEKPGSENVLIVLMLQQGKHGVKPGYGVSCKRKCASKISQEIRESINHEFWTVSHFQRPSFMLHLTKCKFAARKTVGSDSRRKQLLLLPERQ